MRRRTVLLPCAAVPIVPQTVRCTAYGATIAGGTVADEHGDTFAEGIIAGEHRDCG